MKRSNLDKINLTPNFIGSWIIEPTLCEEIIAYYERNQQKQTKGTTSGGIDLETKNRQDLSLSPRELMLSENELYKIYFENLFECYKNFSDKWPHLKKIGKNLNIPAFNVGRYETGQHFQTLHCERAGLGTLHRLFAFMTYLNNVEEGGTTYFDNYNLEIQPKKGLTLIWPAEWTHTHRGNKVIKGCKYMITGHLNFSS